jgi:hypothetical protein
VHNANPSNSPGSEQIFTIRELRSELRPNSQIALYSGEMGLLFRDTSFSSVIAAL